MVKKKRFVKKIETSFDKRLLPGIYGFLVMWVLIELMLIASSITITIQPITLNWMGWWMLLLIPAIIMTFIAIKEKEYYEEE